MNLRNTGAALGMIMIVIGAAGCSNAFHDAMGNSSGGGITPPAPDSADPPPVVATISAVTITGGASTVKPGGTVQYTARVDGTGTFSPTLTWSVTGNTQSATTINAAGELFVDGGEALGTSLTVKVVSAVDGSKNDSITVTVSDYAISLDPSPAAFSPANAGYGDQSGTNFITITVTNTGNQATGALNVNLEGRGAANFDLSTSAAISSIAGGGTGSIVIYPKQGLGVGAHSVTVKVSSAEGRGFDANCILTFEVKSVGGYGINLTLSPAAFSPASVGYAGQSGSNRITLVVTNTGNQATGALNVSLGGTNAGDFTLSGTSISSIAVSGNDSSLFVYPNHGLAVGTYTATVTVSNGNLNFQQNLSFEVESVASYGVSLKDGSTDLPANSHTFTTTAAGYSDAPVLTVTVANTGNVDTGALTVGLSGSDQNSFKINNGNAGVAGAVSSIEVGGNTTFTVKPDTGLSVGEPYTATVTVSNGNISAVTFTVSFTVSLANRTSAPGITVTAVSESVGITYTLDASDPAETGGYDVYYRKGKHSLPGAISDTGFTNASWEKISGVTAGTGKVISYGALTPDADGYGYSLVAVARSANYNDSASPVAGAGYTNIINMAETAPALVGIGWSYDSGNALYEVKNNGNVIITGTGANLVNVASGATAGITLRNATMNNSMRLESGAIVTLTLAGTNYVNGNARIDDRLAGIRVPGNGKITIQGDGSLTATGKFRQSDIRKCGAGIGGDAGENCGIVIINSGTISAAGGEGDSGAAGIGGGSGLLGVNGSGGSGGAITINGGTVTARGGGNGAGAGIGGGGSISDRGGASGTITINGGEITATTTRKGAGIGGGGTKNGTGGNGEIIIINGGTVKATGGSTQGSAGAGAGIGGGGGDGGGGNGGAITINGGTVTATGGSNGTNGAGAGIGGGGGNVNHGYPSMGGGGDGGTITITDGTVTATAIGGDDTAWAAGIGGGGGNNNNTNNAGRPGTATITGGTVTASSVGKAIGGGYNNTVGVSMNLSPAGSYNGYKWRANPTANTDPGGGDTIYPSPAFTNSPIAKWVRIEFTTN